MNTNAQNRVTYYSNKYTHTKSGEALTEDEKRVLNARQNFFNTLRGHISDENSEVAKTMDYIMRNEGNSVVNSTESRMMMYSSEINAYLYPENTFLQYSRNNTAFGASGHSFRISDSSDAPKAYKGRLNALSKADKDEATANKVYLRKNFGSEVEIEYFRVDPVTIGMELTSEVPYDARQETLRAMADAANQLIANFTLVEWAQGVVGEAVSVKTAKGAVGGANDKFVFTTGEARPNPVQGATGNVKKFTKADMLAIATALQRQRMNGRGTMYFLPTTDQWNDIMSWTGDDSVLLYANTGRPDLVAKGILTEIYGVQILASRYRDDWGANILYSYTDEASGATSLTKVDDTAVAGAKMVSAGIAWVDSAVWRAEGSTVVFSTMANPITMGDDYASETRYTAYKGRTDGKGVVMLVENPF